jgi:hypothetical protein
MPHPRDAVIAETAHHDALSQLCRKESRLLIALNKFVE